MLRYDSRPFGPAFPGTLRACAVAATLTCLMTQTSFAQTEDSGATLGEVTVTETAAPEVYSESSDSYVPQAVEVGKTGQSLREIPQSVTVVTRQRMDDQAMLKRGAISRCAEVR